MSFTIQKKHLDEITATSKFSREDLKKLSDEFNKVSKDGQLNREQFASVVQSVLPSTDQITAVVAGGDRSSKLHSLFDAFDVDGNGTVDFKELATGLSILLMGTEQEKITFAFRLLDANGDGDISLEEILLYFKAYIQSRHKLTNTTMDMTRWKAISDHLRRSFRAADLDKNGTISLDEFHKAVSNPDHPLAMVIDGLFVR
mmetsp:Transcript_11553/g.29129  ORF Transcript_11553/g.29129 Transcript_11553/m.29129 type:complete len:201 (-) Transcript_11553:74-676(-)|eukprot:CAMPEP_0177630542 /NCGR_PEP_ID=MMETSP0447-20121125/1263_1 /TAXON_ID=0 /ORGANISM="Stygamoeba regulata, Strain BSH-02190019" /LENGTH=200 /DNA_ID=CAMNT_0019131949 /DNA_START=121 /DNA_END=723 /DNA_ORIENTATION=-